MKLEIVCSAVAAAGVLKDISGAIAAAERCGECGAITARLDGDNCCKWCCYCGARLPGNYLDLGPVRVGRVEEQPTCRHQQVAYTADDSSWCELCAAQLTCPD